MSSIHPHLLLLALANFAIGSGAFFLPGILKPLADAMGVSVAQAGQLTTAYSLAYAVSSPLLVTLTGARDRKRVLIAGLAVFFVANVLSALARDFTLLTAARVLAALGAGVVTPTAAVIAVLNTPPSHRGRALATVFFGIALSSVLGVPLATYLGGTLGWRSAFWLIALLSVLALALVARRLPAPQLAPAVSLRQFASLCLKAQVMLAVAFFLLVMASQFVVFSYIGPLLQHYLNANATQIALVMALMGMAGLLGNFTGGWSADRFGAQRTLAVGTALMALSFVCLPLMRGVWPVAIVVIIAWSLAGYAFMTPQQSRMVQAAPHAPSVALAMNASALYLGSAAGAAFGGALLPRFGYGALSWGAAVLAFAALGLLIASKRWFTTPRTQ